jgi:hypothetical protein
MRLRDHEKIFWPLTWVNVETNPPLRTVEDIGNLAEVTRTGHGRAKMIFLTTDLEGHRFVGALLCDDSELIEALESFLFDHIGKPIKKIKELDVTRLL